MTGFNLIKFVYKVTLLVMLSTGIAAAQQYVDVSNQADVIIDYSVIDALGPSPNISRRNLNRLNKNGGRNNLYVGPKLKFPKASPRQPASEINVISLQPSRNIKKSSAKLEKKRGKGVSNKMHVKRTPKTQKTLKVRPPPPPNLSAPLKTTKALQTPKFFNLSKRSVPPPPSIPLFEQVIRPPAISSTKFRTKSALPGRLKPSKREAKTESRLASIPSIEKSTEAATINRIEFAAESFELSSKASTVLKNLSKTLKKNSELRLQLHAYASPNGGSAIKARRLALSRALSARTYLINRGIDITRIAVKALGDQFTIGLSDRIDLILIKR